MASQEVPPHAQAVIEKCQLCDRGADARYFCEDCQEEMCKQCKTSHLRSKLSQNHTVIRIAREEDEEKPVFCTIHPEEQVNMYCNGCEVPLCLTCIIDKLHQDHAVCKLADAVEKCRKELSKCITDRKQEISELEGTRKTVPDNIQEYNKQHDKTIGSINKRREELKSKIDKAAEALIEDTTKHKTQDVKAIEKQHDDHITRIISDKRTEMESCEEMLLTERGNSIIQLAADFKHELKLAPSRKLPIQVNAPQFLCGKSLDIQEVFGKLTACSNQDGQDTGSGGGDVQSEKMPSGNKCISVGISTTIDTTTLADIDPGKKGIGISIAVLNDVDAWVAHGQGVGSDLAMVDISGQVKKTRTVDFKIWDIAVTSDGVVILTDWKGRNIKKYTQDGQYIDDIETSPSTPTGICMASHKDILVGLQGGSGGTRVVRMTTTGHVKQTIRRDQHNKDLFTNPYLITENINGDVCVVDNYKTVVAVNKKGVLRFRYPDTSKSSNTIKKCFGIACDGLGFILISDRDDHLIHLLDRDGKFVQCILNKQHGIQFPWGLSTDNKGKIWVCNDNGNKVTVVKYRS